MFKNSIDFLFVVVIGVFIVDDEEDLEFFKNLTLCRLKRKNRLKVKFCK